jgi:phage terminase small subunit
MTAKLTPKQEKFCLVYLETGNASEAYRQAYNAENMKPESINRKAKDLIDDVKIAARMKELTAAATSAAVMTRQEAMERLSSFARTDLADLVEFGEFEVGENEDGEPIIQSSWRIKPETLRDPKKMAAISELNASKDGIKIKTHSPLQAIQQLAKMQGWEAAQKFEHAGAGGGPIQVQSASDLTDEQLAAIAAGVQKSKA